MSLDSEALFRQRLDELGLADLRDEFAANGWGTLGSFAFACSTPPGTPGAVDAFQTEVVNLLAIEASAVPALRRLYFEAWTLSAAELKGRLERREDDPPKRLPAPEREARRARLCQRLGPGLKLEGFQEFSNSWIAKLRIPDSAHS